MSNFKVGDRVEAIGAECLFSNPYLQEGMLGTVVGISGSAPNIAVQFDAYIEGHSVGGRGKEGFCWFMYEYELKKVETKGEDTNE